MTQRHQHRRRRGATLYVAVMGVGMIVGVIALTTSLTDRMLLRESDENHLQLAAAHNARGGLEYALNWMNRTPNWRAVLASGVDTAEIQTGSGRFQFRVTDVDGDLDDDPRDHAVLRVVGEASQSRASYALEVDIEPAGRALTCLAATVSSASDIDLNTNSRIEGSGFVYSGNDIDSTGGDVDLDAEAVGTAIGSGFNGELRVDADTREMPSEHVFAWYVEHGTEIAIGELDDAFPSADRRIDTKRFSRALNDLGAANPHGIYWIDCGGNHVRIRWSRSLGTLVLLNAGSGAQVEDVCLLQAEAQNYPVLMVQGDLRLDLSSPSSDEVLNEGLGVNYNPAGVPYAGVEDNDDLDSYPARLDGIVYVTGTLEIADDCVLTGNLIAGAIIVDADSALDIDYTPYSLNYPPPGFSAGQGVRMLPGSYRRVGL